MTRRTSFLLFLFLNTLSFSLAFGQYANPDTGFVRERYTKHEYMIAMRDGVRLFTTVYTPKDTTVLHPIIMMRTPYSCAPYGEGNFPIHLGEQDYYYFESGYIKVVQDVRGRYMSEGTYEDVRP